MSNNKQQVELTDITAPLLEATQGLTMEDRDASTSTTIIDETIGFLLDCAQKGEDLGKQRPPSICKVSRILRDHSESSYEPQLVSIGPIHRENEKLQEFEWLKGCYLDDLLNRCRFRSTPKEMLEACLKKVKTKISIIRESYAGVKKNYNDVELARMMVMDGCFILEFCFKHEGEYLYFPNKMQAIRIAMDLMLLENQVPFFVLQALFDCLPPGILKAERSFTLTDVLDTHLAPYIKLFRGKKLTTDVDSDSTHVLLSKGEDSEAGEHSAQRANMPGHVDSYSTPAHVLGYLHKLYHLEAAKSSEPNDAEASKPVEEEQAAKSWNRIMDAAFHSIVELDRSGMNFKCHQEDEWSMTIKFQSSRFACLPWFWSKPTLLMPTLVIDDTTELILRNFIAYEQSFPQGGYYFTSYAYAMDMLIDTQEDIAKLVESKVLVNALGSNQEAADMINKICKNMFVTDFYYTDEFKEIDTYYNGYWPNNIARLRRVYFSNPWSVIALLGGIIVFLATVVSTIFAILEYFR